MSPRTQHRKSKKKLSVTVYVDNSCSSRLRSVIGTSIELRCCRWRTSSRLHNIPTTRTRDQIRENLLAGIWRAYEQQHARRSWRRVQANLRENQQKYGNLFFGGYRVVSTRASCFRQKVARQEVAKSRTCPTDIQFPIVPRPNTNNP